MKPTSPQRKDKPKPQVIESMTPKLEAQRHIVREAILLGVISGLRAKELFEALRVNPKPFLSKECSQDKHGRKNCSLGRKGGCECFCHRIKRDEDAPPPKDTGYSFNFQFTRR